MNSPPKMTESEPQVGRWTGEFLDPELERAFQQRVYRGNARDACIALSVGALLMMLFFYTDYLYLRGGEGVWVLGAMRGGTSLLAMGAALAFSLRPSLIISGWLMTALEMTVHAAYGLLVWYRPEDLAWHSATFMTMLMSLFILFPNRLRLMVVAAIFGIVVMLVHVELAMKLPASRMVALGLVLALPALIGFIAARRFDISRRLAFLRILKEQQSNDNLQAEVARRLGLEAELRRLAETDSLTGLCNRRQFEARAAEVLEGAAVGGQPATFCLLDLDHFKRINDTLGHAAGDAVLTAVAQLCRHHFRGGDLVARLGGEEFVIMLPGTDPADAEPLCRRLLAAVAELSIQHEGQTISVTATMGVAGARPGETLNAVLARADAALYRGKEAGRNQVVVCDGGRAEY